MFPISMADLRAQYAAAYMDMMPTPESLLEIGRYIGGEPVATFEKSWAAYCDTKHAVGTSSGTAALTACFAAIIEAQCVTGRIRVITQANTFVATVNAALRIPAVEVTLIDCDDNFGMSVPQLEAVLERDKGTYALTIVVPVHMYGIMCDMPAIAELAHKYPGVCMVEDASHAHGSEDVMHRAAGSYGDMAAFSLFPAKPLGAAGDAGIVVTDVDYLADIVRSYCNCGRGREYDSYVREGFTYRLDTIQATVLSGKLAHLNDWREAREGIAARYQRQLKDVPGIRLPSASRNGQCAWYAFPLRLSTPGARSGLQSLLTAQGIPSKRYYDKSLASLDWLRTHPRVHALENTPQACAIAEEVLCIPNHEFLAAEQQAMIIHTIASGTWV